MSDTPRWKRREAFRRRSGISLLVYLALGAGTTDGADDRSAKGVFLPTESEQQVLWQRVESARDAKNWDAVLDGLARFSEIVTRPELNTVLEGGGGMAWGIRRVVSAIVSSLPPEELVRYKARLDPLVTGLWEKSRARATPEEHRRLRRLVLRDLRDAAVYPQALKEAADDAFESGQWIDVRASCEELLRLDDARIARGKTPGATRDSEAAFHEDRIRARVLLAQACAVLGDAAAAQRQIDALREPDRGPSEKKISDALEEEVKALLRAKVKDVPPPPGDTRPVQESPLEPAVFPLEAAPSGEAPFRLGSVIWERRVVGSKLRSFVAERSRGSPTGDVPLPYYCVARDGWIVFQHADRICAYSTGQGREVWTHPLDLSSEDVTSVHAPLIGPDACYYATGPTLSALALPDGNPLWQRTFLYDQGAKTIYTIEGPPPAEPEVVDEGTAPAQDEPVPPAGKAEPGGEKPAPKEKAGKAAGEKNQVGPDEKKPDGAGDANEDEKDAARSKDTKRKVAARNPEGAGKQRKGAPPTRTSCSLSPAIEVRDAIVLAVHVRAGQEILQFLTCLDRQGERAWTTFLGSSQGGNLLALGGTPSVPLFDGRNVYHLTNTGLLAAADGEDGTLLWITSYAGLSARGKREAIRSENRWQANPILPIGPELILAPQDCAFLLAVQRETGEVVWRAPRESRSALVGSDSRACFLVGRDAAAIACSGPDRGRVLWRFAPAGPMGSCEPAGRAFLARDEILIPGRDSLLCLSTRDGKLLSQTLWDFSGIGGNLLLTRTTPANRVAGSPASAGAPLLAVANPSGVLVYSGFEAEALRIKGLPADRAETLLERAKFHLKNAEVEAGIGVLRSWKDTAPPVPLPNSVLDHLHLDVAEIIEHLIRGEAAGRHTIELLRMRVEIERMPRRRVAASIELASRLEKNGDARGALQALHDALGFDNPATDYSPDGTLDVPSSAYIRDRIQALRKSVADPASICAAVDSAAREALRTAQNKLRTPSAYLDVIRRFPFTPAAAEAYLDLSRIFRDAQSYDLAISALEGYLADYPGAVDPSLKSTSPVEVKREELVRVNLLTADLLRRSGRAREARQRYLDVLAQHAAVRVSGIEGVRPGETVEEYVKPLLRDPSLLAVQSEEPALLRFPVRMAWRSPADLQATKRTFLSPGGAIPEQLRGCFLTQSEDEIELREVETGLPVWKSYLEMIPGFEFDDPTRGRGFSLPRSGRLAFSGEFLAGEENGGGSVLVLHDERNIFAIDPAKGTVRWHVPVGPEKKEVRGATDPFLPRLREKLRGAQVTSSGVFAATSRGRLFALNLKGETLWDTKLRYTPATYSPLVHRRELYVLSQPPGIRVHDLETGGELADEKVAALSQELKEPFLRAPIELEDGRVVIVSAGGLRCIDFGEQTFAWKFERKNAIEEVFYFPEFPGECIVASSSRANRWPSVAAVSLHDGRELWRFEKFPPERAAISVVRDRNRVYILHGNDQWKLTAIQVRDGVEPDKPIVETLWPNDVPLGSNNGSSMLGRVHVSGDSVFFLDTDNHSISVYDKLLGTSRSSSAVAMGGFTKEKEDCALAISLGKLIILADGGDCAFESALPGPSAAGLIFGSKGASLGAPTEGRAGPDPSWPLLRGDPAEPWSPSALAAWGNGPGGGGMEYLRQFLSKPGSLESTTKLALQYFKGGDLDSAIEILNRALLSEDLLQENGAQKRYLLSFLLDGIKEENMKKSVPRIVSHRFLVPPSIDGDLSDGWDISTRIHLNSPKNVGTIPGPGQLRDWDGEEDLSAVLYTGWDDKYFYFALDVLDDVLHPYDRDAENWKGDCLIIGLDPTNDEGWHQHGNDQLMTLALTIPKRNKLDKQKKNEEEQGEDEEEDEDDAKKPDGLFSVKRKDDYSGAIYEVGLPWSSFFQSAPGGVPPPVGYTFGLSLLLTDDDTGQGATKTLSLNPCHLLPRNQKNSPVWRFIIPYFFPKVTLE